jgi:hypothetical protein
MRPLQQLATQPHCISFIFSNLYSPGSVSAASIAAAERSAAVAPAAHDGADRWWVRWWDQAIA